MKKNSFIEGTFIATTFVVLVKIIGMLYVIPFYAIVGEQGGALYSYAYNIYIIFLSISAAGIPSAISKLVSEYNATGLMEAKTRAYKLAQKYIFYISIVSFIVLFVFAEELAHLILGDLIGGNTIEDVSFVIRAISFAVLVIPHLSVTKGYLQGHNFITAPSTANLLEQLIRVFIVLAGSFFVYKVLSLSLTLAVGIALSGAFFGGLIAYIYLLRKIKKNKKELKLDAELKKDKISNKEILKKIAVYAVPFIIINIISSIYSFTNMVFILRTLNDLGFSVSDVEFIASAIATWSSKICMIVNSIAMGMTVSLIPSIVESYATKNWHNLTKNINSALKIVIYVSIPLTFGLSILATPVWTIFYNTNVYGGKILGFMVFNALLGNISMVVSTALNSCNKFKGLYIMAIVSALLNVILNIPLMYLMYYLGIDAFYGATLATMISYSTGIMIGLYILRKHHNIKYKETFKATVKFLIPAFVMTVCLLIINQFLPFNSYHKLEALLIIIIDMIIGGLIFILVSFKLNIPQNVFGTSNINKILKKLTFGKFQINDI